MLTTANVNPAATRETSRGRESVRGKTREPEVRTGELLMTRLRPLKGKIENRRALGQISKIRHRKERGWRAIFRPEDRNAITVVANGFKVTGKGRSCETVCVVGFIACCWSASAGTGPKRPPPPRRWGGRTWRARVGLGDLFFFCVARQAGVRE